MERIIKVMKFIIVIYNIFLIIILAALLSACCTSEKVVKLQKTEAQVPPIQDTLYLPTPEPPSGVIPQDMRGTVDSLNKLLERQNEELALIPRSGILRAEKYRDGYKAIVTVDFKKRSVYLDIVPPPFPITDTIEIINPNPQIIVKEIGMVWWKKVLIYLGFAFLGVCLIAGLWGFSLYKRAFPSS